MMKKARYWRIASLGFAGVGSAVVAYSFVTSMRWTVIGCTLVVLGMALANGGRVALRTRSLEVEYEAGYRAGLRAGRKAPTMRLVNISDWRDEHGGISQAALGAVAGHGSPARRSAQDALRPAQGCREDLG